MTIATKLFYYWRSRTGRDSDPEPDAALRLPRGRRGNGGHHPREEGDSSRRSHPGIHHGRHLSHHRASPTIWLDHRGASDFEAGNSSSGGIRSCRDSGSRQTRDESDDRRLPGAVVQARARLLERLQSVHITGGRQSTSSSGISQNERSCSDDWSVIVSGDWEAQTRRECSKPGIPLPVPTLRTDRTLSFCDTGRKPPGLSWDKLGLRQQVFRYAEEGGVAKASFECCICLERFLEGDGLIRLQCGHRFHPSCLEPWLRTHVDCPYCRSSITC
ncbi:probable E3 ubiquitin-protein ligase RHY1A isoform X2 [Elaeis guineensis]|uniref:Probable E3 ubiquitin-protein ligase RHY1A isoform X2 n=1 Tax=Elaeis guineensis var. tenera TaxID=51953 RepID=A0A6I9QBF1_ELAGV|nr:probable E3 ubiquitin-protein ligase RHY1A isoform X2 [Elaeis guineensis]